MGHAQQPWRPGARFYPIVVLWTPPPFALQSRISFYWGLFTIRSWLKTLILSDWKRPHISRRKDMPFLRADWLWGREPYSMLLWRAFWTCRIGARLITLPSPVLKYLSFCVSILPIIHHWSAVTKALVVTMKIVAGTRAINESISVICKESHALWLLLVFKM